MPNIRKLLSIATVASALGTGVAASNIALADPIVFGLSVEPGISQNFQSGPDGANALGAGAKLDFLFEVSDAANATLSVTVQNIGISGILTTFGLSLRDDIFAGLASTFSSDGAGCDINGCFYTSDNNPSAVKSFLNDHVTVGADLTRGNISGTTTNGVARGIDPADGIEAGEMNIFRWIFTGGDFQTLIDLGGGSFIQIVAPQQAGGVEGPNQPFETFWAFHVQSLGPDGALSDRIGGQVTTNDVPLPGSLALLGGGLMLLAGVTRRRRNAAI